MRLDGSARRSLPPQRSCTDAVVLNQALVGPTLLVEGCGFVSQGISQLPGVAPTGHSCLLKVNGDGGVMHSELAGHGADGCSQLVGVD